MGNPDVMLIVVLLFVVAAAILMPPGPGSPLPEAATPAKR